MNGLFPFELQADYPPMIVDSFARAGGVDEPRHQTAPEPVREMEAGGMSLQVYTSGPCAAILALMQKEAQSCNW